MSISETAWRRLLATVSAQGDEDGRRAFEQWRHQQRGLGQEHLATAAHRILQALHNDENLGVPLAPQYTESNFASPPSTEKLLDVLGSLGAEAAEIPLTWQQQADWEYRDAFETAVRLQSGEWARRTLDS